MAFSPKLLQMGASGAGPANYIEDVFSCFLYEGQGSGTQTITNGIDLAGKGGLVWTKNRSVGTGAAANHYLCHSITTSLISNNTDADGGVAIDVFNSNGYSFNSSVGIGAYLLNGGTNLVSWTFRKQPKFFDVVTYTGNGVAGRTIAHNLGSVPGCIILKSISEAGVNWNVFHRSIAPTGTLRLNTTDAQTSGLIEYYFGNDTAYVAPTSTVFTVGGSSAGNQVNGSGATYVAYLFAHDAGGFGLTGTDNVISCGSYVGNGLTAGPQVTLGYEPQWVLRKNASNALGGPTGSAGGWSLVDNMRGLSQTTCPYLFANLSAVEDTTTVTTGYIIPNATGFVDAYTRSGDTYIYIAIRRGPMKVPTVGTSVFGLNARTGTGAVATVTGSAGVSDAVLIKNRGSAVASLFSSRLTGTGYVITSSGVAEASANTTILQANPWDVMDGVKVGTTSTITNASASTFINYLFKRAPSFFDEVCYTGTGVAGLTITHNLGIVPEMIIVKLRSDAGEPWNTLLTVAPAGSRLFYLNTTLAGASESAAYDVFGNASNAYSPPTATNFKVGGNNSINGSAKTYVAYLFATCAGVSKVGSYTGTGTTLQINCGFTGGARFVLIKRTDDTGDWYVWDSARGIVAGNDPYLLLNSTAAEVTNTDYVDTYNAGFELSSTAPAAINNSGGTYIFLAIA